MSPSALIVFSQGAEEIEMTTVFDVLVRAGISTTLFGLQGKDPQKCSRGLFISPNANLSDVENNIYDAVIMPGGLEGAQTMEKSEIVGKILKKHQDSDKYVAAICAAPIALEAHQIFKGKRLTAYPGFQEKLKSYTFCEDNVVVDGKLVTSRGPGTAFAFALKLVELLINRSKSDEIAKQLLVQLH